MSIPPQIFQRLPKQLPRAKRYSRYAVEFDNTLSQHISTPTAGFSALEGTWLVWLKDLGSTNWTNYLSLHLNATNFIYLQRHSNGNAFLISQSGGIGQNVSPGAGTCNVDDGLWHLSAITFSAAAGRARLYFDGQLISWNVAWAGFAVPATFFIGAQSAAARFIKAREDEVQVLNYEATAHDILTAYYRGYAKREAGSVLNLRLEEGVGLLAADTSGQGNNGTLAPAPNPPTWSRIEKYELLTEVGL